MPLQTLQLLEKKIGRQFRLLELKKGVLERKIEGQLRRFEQKLDQKKGSVRLDDVRFIRSWMEKPLAMGAVAPSGKALARTMAGYVDPQAAGPVIELGPGTGPVTQALVTHGVDPARLVLVEFDPTFCKLLRQRYPTATVVQGDAYGLRQVLGSVVQEPAAAVVSSLPLFTKPLKTRLRLVYEAFSLMLPGSPFVQFTYAAVPPIPEYSPGARVGLSQALTTVPAVIGSPRS
jgi:phosphatidylethanolamine/phosphatidyl-N-methylethanolamine N-methyltransferase